MSGRVECVRAMMCAFRRLSARRRGRGSLVACGPNSAKKPFAEGGRATKEAADGRCGREDSERTRCAGGRHCRGRHEVVHALAEPRWLCRRPRRKHVSISSWNFIIFSSPWLSRWLTSSGRISTTMPELAQRVPRLAGDMPLTTSCPGALAAGMMCNRPDTCRMNIRHGRRHV